MIPYRPDVDGLRAVAIVTVVASHAGVPGWSGGYVGVDVFFVISGFLITSLLLEEARESGRIDLWGFYARRVRRLLPALSTVLLATLAASPFLLGRLHGERQGLAKSALATLLLNANHYFLGMADGYFDSPAELQPLLHIWSLSLEEQFYLIWPPVLAGLLAARWIAGFERKVLTVLALVLPMSFVACVWLTMTRPSVGFYLMPSRAWELALGGLLALAPFERWRGGRTRWGVALGTIGLGAIGVAVTAFERTTSFPGFAAALPVAGTAAVIAGNALAPAGLPAALLSWRPVVFVGLLSYSWYLWHWPLVALARGFELGARSVSRDLLLGGVVGLALAAATYRWIERPIRQSVELKRRGARATVRLGALATLFSVLVAGSFGAWAKYVPRSEQELRLIAAQEDEPPLRRLCNNTLDQSARLPPLEGCVTPLGSERADLVLWGDSMADHWVPAFAEAALRTGRSVCQLTRDACPPLLGFAIHHRDPAQPGRCLEFQGMALAEIERLHREQGLKAVVLSASWRLSADGPLVQTLTATLDRLDHLGLRTLVIGPTPTLPVPAPDCLLRFEASRCALTREAFEVQRETLAGALAESMKNRPNVTLVDPALFLCNEVECPATMGGLILYRDAAHLTSRASAGFSERVGSWLDWLE